MANADYNPSELYRAPVVLWVEDELTRAYLSTLWDDVRFQYLVAGGNEGVRVMVCAARAEKISNVFGIVDRDDGSSNEESWASKSGPPKVCRLPVHEIENYLLDGEALQQTRYNNLRQDAEGIEKHMAKKAEGSIWYTACRLALRDLKLRFQSDFPPRPPQDLTDQDKARLYICNSSWYQKLESRVQESTREKIERALTACGKQAEQQFKDGSWRRDFAAKEILDDVISRICHRRTLPSPNDSATIRLNLAKEVAVHQRASGKMDPDLAMLKKAFENWLTRPG